MDVSISRFIVSNHKINTKLWQQTQKVTTVFSVPGFLQQVSQGAAAPLVSTRERLPLLFYCFVILLYICFCLSAQYNVKHFVPGVVLKEFNMLIKTSHKACM